MPTVKSYIKQPINSASDAVDFILNLYLDRKLWHFDDDPADFVDNKTGNPGYTKAELKHLYVRQLELFRYLPDPFEIPVLLLQTSSTY